jgi:hypothetical protein
MGGRNRNGSDWMRWSRKAMGRVMLVPTSSGLAATTRHYVDGAGLPGIDFA